MDRETFTAILPNGIRLTFLPTGKFKTISMALFLHQELRADLAARTALLPAVLERGSARYPDTIALRRELERLYGAELAADVHKKGENHLISFTMETVHGRYVGEDGGLLRRGLGILGSVVADPLVEGEGAFRSDYVNQEKEQLARDIRGLLNDKATYALEKCLREMCAAERFGVFKLGRLEDLEGIDPPGLFRYYRQLFSANPLDLYVVGDLEPEQVQEAAAETLSFSRQPAPGELPETVVRRPVEEVRYYEERLPVNQAKLVMGYRTNTSFKDPLFYPLLMYNGVLGGFPHSKLFLNVREKAGLAYYAYSRLERHKGIMVVAAGIEESNYPKARAIVERQVEAMARGEITADEMEHTRRALVNGLRASEDSPYQMVYAHLDGRLGGRADDTEEMIRQIEKVTVADVTEIAALVRLDTVFLLRGLQGGGKAHA